MSFVLTARFAFLRAQMFADRVQIAIELVRMLFTDLPNLFNYRVVAHHSDSMSSSGVQISGGS